MRFYKDVSRILSIFSDNFKNVLYSVSEDKRNTFIENFYFIYRKWYYSSFFDSNFLSPAYIINIVNNNYKEKGDYFVPVAKIKSKKNSNFQGFDFDFLNYNINNHPIVNDLKIFADLSEIINVNDDGIILDESINKILLSISIYSVDYLEYLLNIGKRLGIFEKMPSIYSEIYRTSRDYCDFFENGSRVCFDEIFEEALKLSCEILNDFFPKKKPIFFPKSFKDIIKEPVYINDFFKDAYSGLGVNTNDIFNYDTILSIDKKNSDCEFEIYNNIEKLAEAVLSSNYLFKILVDKWFITPFGDYFKFILPIYIYPYEFRDKMNRIAEELKFHNNRGLSSSLYYPCFSYCNTPIAQMYFDIQQPYIESNQFFNEFSINTIIESIIDYTVKNKQNEIIQKIKKDFRGGPFIYKLKISFAEEKNFWKIIEIEDNITLNILHILFCQLMNLFPTDSYSFFNNINMSPFSQYTPISNKKRINKKTENTKLSSLNIKLGQSFIYYYTIDNKTQSNYDNNTLNNSILIEAQLLEIKEKQSNSIYPMVIEMSNLAKLYQDNFQ